MTTNFGTCMLLLQKNICGHVLRGGEGKKRQQQRLEVGECMSEVRLSPWSSSEPRIDH